MTKRVLIIGGYGNFGSYIAKALASDENIKLYIGGRSLSKATALSGTLPTDSAEPIALDVTKTLDEALKQTKPDIIIHTSGPFQGQSYHVAEAAIKHGAHYIDLADGRDFVEGIPALNKQACAQGLLVVSGASSVPCLSSCIIDHYLPEFTALTEVHYGISTAQITNRGHATTAAVLSYAGKPFETLAEGEVSIIYGWQNLHCETFTDLGKRWLGNCDIPDLALFPTRYPTLKTHRFYAGLELPFLHIGLWSLTWLVRMKLIKNLDTLTVKMLKASFWFDRFGSEESGFYMSLSGEGLEGEDKCIRFDLTAKSGDGPYIPCMPAILLTKKLAKDELTARGAMPCVGLITLDEYLSALEPLDITWRVEQVKL